MILAALALLLSGRPALAQVPPSIPPHQESHPDIGAGVIANVAYDATGGRTTLVFSFSGRGVAWELRFASGGTGLEVLEVGRDDGEGRQARTIPLPASKPGERWGGEQPADVSGATPAVRLASILRGISEEAALDVARGKQIASDERLMSLYEVVLSLFPAAPAVGPDEELAHRACPGFEEEVKLDDGQTLTRRPLFVCYSEPHADVDGARDLRVIYYVEGTIRKDTWGEYARLLRQVTVVWADESGAWEVRFVTDPRADTRGIQLWKREGAELLSVRHTTPDGKAELNRFVSRNTLEAGTLQGAYPDNPWQGDRLVPIARKVMDALRDAGYRGYRQLRKGYIVYQASGVEPKGDPIVMKDRQISEVLDLTRTLEKTAEK